MGVSLNTFKKAINKLGNYVSSNFLRNDSLISNDKSITINSNGDSKVNISVDTTTLMRKAEYASDINEGYVKKADEAKMVEALKNAQPGMYLGTDINGNYGAYFLPISKESKNSGIYQMTLLNPPINSVQSLESRIDLNDCEIFVQAYKFVAGEQDIVSILKEFNNGNQLNFNYNTENLTFTDDGCKITNEYSIELTQENDYYVSHEIDIDSFIIERGA